MRHGIADILNRGLQAIERGSAVEVVDRNFRRHQARVAACAEHLIGIHEVGAYGVGEHEALEAPFAAQHVGYKRSVAARPRVADAVERRHRRCPDRRDI